MFARTSVVSVDPHRARELQAAGALILDVRELHEWLDGHVDGAELIPLGELGHRFRDLPRDRTIVVMCATGNRSSTAVAHLASAGLDVVNLDGGIVAWQRAGLPVRPGR